MKKLIVAGVVTALLLTGAGKVEAQCSGYSSSTPTNTILTPAQVAAQGGMTATITGQVTNVFDANGNNLGLASHNLNATDGGTKIQWSVASNNATSATLFVYANGTLIGQYAEPLNGSAGTWVLNSANLGDTYSMLYKVENSDGRPPTQDLVTLYVSSGSSPGIVSQDKVPTNFYANMGSSFHGPSMLNSCSTCQLHPNLCINKMHHPKQHWQVTNNTSGEYHDAGWVYGLPACENCAVSYSGSSPFISMLPGDQLSFNVENTVICDEFGVIYDNNGGDEFAWDTEYAFTTEKTIPSMCQLFPEPNGQTGIECPVSYNCQPAAGTPDFNPAYLASDLWCAKANYCNDSDIPNFPKNWLTGAWGARVKVFGAWTPWFFPFYESSGFVIGLRKTSDFINYLYSFGNLAVPSPFAGNPINCTNKDRGTSPLPPYWP